jgi:hypothetical protein
VTVGIPAGGKGKAAGKIGHREDGKRSAMRGDAQGAAKQGVAGKGRWQNPLNFDLRPV